MLINEIINEEQLDEINWKKGLATAAMAAGAMGALGTANARVVPGQDADVNRLAGKPVATQQANMTVDQAKKDPRYGVDPEFTKEVDKADAFSNGLGKQADAQMPNQNLQAVDQVERTANGITITQDGNTYNVKVMAKGGPTPRGGKMMKVQQAQVGERGIGNYTVYLMPNGTAYLYK